MSKSEGYHLTNIRKGTFGEVSKIEEELEELKDSIYQENKVMILNELSDLIGSIEGFLEKRFSDISLDD
jgi:hypothetical protein